MAENEDTPFACPKCKCPLTVSPKQAMSGLSCPFCSHSWKEGDISHETKDGRILGWKGFTVVDTAAGIRLQSPMFPTVFDPVLEGMKASCGGGGDLCQHDPEGRSPGKSCNAGHGCGFYAGRTRSHLMNLGYNGYQGVPTVLAEVAMWGRVVLAVNGFRAEFMRPHRIEVPYAQMGGLDALGVSHSWELVNILGGVYPECEVYLANTIATEKDGPKWCPHCGVKVKNREPRCGYCNQIID